MVPLTPTQPPNVIAYLPVHVLLDHNAHEEPTVVEPAAPVAAAPQVNQHPMRTPAKSGIQKPNTRYALLTSRLETKKPKKIREAMAHPDWNPTVTDEIVKIHTLHTWTLVPQTLDMNMVSSKWVYADKITPDGKRKPKA